MRGCVVVWLCQIWADALRTKAKSPYMSHSLQGKRVGTVAFRPYEDILGIGHAQVWHWYNNGLESTFYWTVCS